MPEESRNSMFHPFYNGLLQEAGVSVSTVTLRLNAARAIGVLSLAVGYGVYAYKNKGKMSTSVYLMHLRVGAQGAAVGALTLGLIYTMANQYLLKKKDNEK